MIPAPIAEIFAMAQAGEHGLSTAFAAFAHGAAPVAVAALWQGTAVAVALAICLRLTPRLSAAHRFSVWAGGFAVVVGLQALPLFFHSVMGHFVTAQFVTAQGNASAVSAGGAASPWLELDARWTLAIAGLWLMMAALRAADLAIHTVRLRTLWKNARPIDEIGDGIGDRLFAEQTVGRARIPVCTTTELDRPSVIGFFAPRILIPDWLYSRLTPGELDQVILHECEHLRRRDDWTNLLQKFCLVLFPLNPALAWMEHRLCREREMACDEGVVRVTRAPRAYAACLASMAERHLEQNLARRAAAALSLGAFEGRSELAGRVHSILWRKNVLSPLGSRALVGVVGCGLLVGAVELARSPQLVGFVSAQTAGAQTAEAPQAVPSPERLVALDGRNESAFRATNAMAILPAATQRQARKSAARRSLINGAAASREVRPVAVASVERSVESSVEPRQRFVKAEMNGSGTQAQAVPQQWIVLTTWQQVESPAYGTDGTTDYNASANADAEVPAQRATQQIAVTQLIFRFYPGGGVSARGQHANSGAQNDSAKLSDSNASDAQGNSAGHGNSAAHAGSNPAHSNFILSRRAVLPIDSGWLVIQL
jgi:beta-lactamase regulating signal transducer with metallopeptidase domain